MSDTLIETAARAANLEAGRQRGLTFVDDWDTLTEQERGGWRLVARACLSVLHEAEEQGGWELENCRRRIANQRKELDALRVAHSGSRAVELAEEASRYRTALSNIRFRMNGGGELSPATLRSIVDVALDSPSVAGERYPISVCENCAGFGHCRFCNSSRTLEKLEGGPLAGEQEDGWRQRNELLNTFAPTEPTVDDLPGSRVDGTLLHQLAVAVMTATTEAQEGMKPSDEALRHRDALVRRAQDVASPAVAGEQKSPTRRPGLTGPDHHPSGQADPVTEIVSKDGDA